MALAWCRSSRVHLSHCLGSPAQTLGTSFPIRCCCQNCGSATPKRQEENPAGHRAWVQGGEASPTPPGGQKGGTWSHHPHGITVVIWGAWTQSCWGAQRRRIEGRESPRAKPSVISHRANQCTQAAQEFYHLKTIPGRFLLVHPAVYQTEEQASPAWPAEHRHVRSPPIHGGGGVWVIHAARCQEHPAETQPCCS